MSVQRDSQTDLNRSSSTLTRCDSLTTQQTEVWGLNGALEEEEGYDEFDVRTELAETEYDENDDRDDLFVKPERDAWPLPPVGKNQFVFNDPRVEKTSIAHNEPNHKGRKGRLTNYERLEREMLMKQGMVSGAIAI